MSTLLQINTSLFAGNGQSTQLANDFVRDWQVNHADANIIVRDLANDPVPHLNAVRLTALATPAEQRTGEQREVAAFSDTLIAELNSADVIVIGLPLYNFGIPSALQAYFDHVARAGVTFKYSAAGPVGFFQGKRVLIFATRGGKHAGTQRDSATAHVRNFLGLIGLTYVEFIYAEGLNIDATTRKQELTAARLHSTQLAHSPEFA